MRANSVVERRGRIVIGRTGRRLVAAKQRESVLVFGPPGSGKTSAFAIPNILEWDGPAVVCSVTSEILRTTIRVRSSHGRMAWVYDPTGSVGDVLRAGWDPIPQCADFQKATRLAHHLVSLSDLMSVTQGDFWQSAASDLLGPLLHAAAIGQRSIEDVMGWLADPRSSQAASPGGKSTTAFGTALAILDGAHSHDAQIAARTLRGATVGTAAETMLSFATTARVALKVFSTRAGIQSTLQQPATRLRPTPRLFRHALHRRHRRRPRRTAPNLRRPHRRVDHPGRGTYPTRRSERRSHSSCCSTRPPTRRRSPSCRSTLPPSAPATCSSSPSSRDYGQVVRRWGRDNAQVPFSTITSPECYSPAWPTPTSSRSSPISSVNAKPSAPPSHKARPVRPAQKRTSGSGWHRSATYEPFPPVTPC